jgi:acetylornithine deacetylase/succinyl-diaminopimelate desuccinylase-like protein
MKEISVNQPASLQPDALLNKLRLLCAQASVSGQSRELAECADSVVAILRDVGLDCQIVATAGAPIVIGRYDAGAERTLLLYGRYDVPPAGLRRSWSIDPFRPTVRNNKVYARGAVVKAELVARAAALQTLIEQKVPLNLTVVVEGESLIGSPHLSAAREAIGHCDVSLWSGGGFDSAGLPLFYSGVKGLLQVELQVTTATTVVPASYAATAPNPIWTLVLALSSIKSEFEEILIEGFYDEIAPPSRQALNSVQGLDVGEQARRDAWGVQQFVASVGGAMLTRTETFSPTCNISNLHVNASTVPSIPQRASAEVQFQLVPDLQPGRVFELLQGHIQARGFTDLHVKLLPGAYKPLQSAQLPFDAPQAAATVFGKPAHVLPLAPFSAPAALLAPDAPLVSCGLERPSSSIFGADEHVQFEDVMAHTRLMIELITRIAI